MLHTAAWPEDCMVGPKFLKGHLPIWIEPRLLAGGPSNTTRLSRKVQKESGQGKGGNALKQNAFQNNLPSRILTISTVERCGLRARHFTTTVSMFTALRPTLSFGITLGLGNLLARDTSTTCITVWHTVYLSVP